MVIFFFILAAIMLWRCKVRVKSFNVDYLSKSNSNATRGIFAILIFLRHVYSYFKLNDNWLDNWFKVADRFLGQGIVCLFLFYTGYGIYESYKKNDRYFDTFLENRFLKTLVSFDLAVMLYWLVQTVVFDKFIDLSTLIKALIGLSAIGNSNWYMFYIFIAYIIVFVSFRVCKKQHVLAICLTLFLTIIYIVYANKSDIPLWWNDTALCVPLGMIYSYFKERIEKLLFGNNWIYYFTTIISIFLWIITTLQHLENKDTVLVIFSRLAFTFSYILICMKMQFNNRILAWLGKYSFGIYIIQRIPMILLQKYWLPNMNNYVFVILSLVFTLVLAYLFAVLDKAVGNMLFKKEKTVEAKADN